MSLATDAERWPLVWGGSDGIYMGYWNRLVGVDRAPYTMACTFPLGTRTQHIGDDICNLRTPTSSWATQVGRANGNASLFRHVWQA